MEKTVSDCISLIFRALLQRISLILTAPPKITDADYQRLRKLATRDKVKEKFEKALDEKRNEEIFDRINKTNAYYHHKEWEEDYARQKAGQKFMRQVTYQRPKGFVDPFAPLERREEDEDPDDIDLDELLKEDEAKPQSDKGSRTPVNKSSRGGVATSKSSGHLNSVRTLRDKTSAGPHSADGAKNHQRSKTSPSKLERGSSRQKDSFNRSATGESTGSDDAASVAVHEPRPADKNVPVLLSHVHRHTPLRDGRLDVDRKLPNTDILTDIQCWRKTVQSDEIRDSTMKHLDTDFEDDGDSVNSANSTQPTAGKRRPVHIMTVRAEILDFSERETIMLLSVDKLLQSWQLHQNKDSNLLACAVQSMDLSNADTQQNDDNEKLDLIARQIAAEVSLIIENDTKVLFGTTNILRIVLPAHFAIAEVFKRVPKKGSDLSAELGVSGPARLQTNRLASFESIDTHDRDVDVEAASGSTDYIHSFILKFYSICFCS